MGRRQLSPCFSRSDTDTVPETTLPTQSLQIGRVFLSPAFSRTFLCIRRGERDLDELGDLRAGLSFAMRLSQFGNRLIQLPGGVKGVPEIAVGVGIRGHEPNGITEFGDRLWCLPWASNALARLVWNSPTLGLVRVAFR